MSASHVSPFSGSWYPGEPSEIESLLDRLFGESETRTGTFLARPVAFVTPHAGLAYSGLVASAVYRHLRAWRPERVALLGFAHRGAAPGVWLPDIQAIRTPLGEVAVDTETVAALAASGRFRIAPEATLCDHSIEIQLPLLQRACPGVKLIPLYVSHLPPSERTLAAEAVAELAENGAVLIASSDMTHYGPQFRYQPFPADEFVADRLRVIDDEVIQAASGLSPSLFIEALDATGSTVCGREPIALLLAALHLLDGADEIFQETLDYQTSGDITGDFSHSVSYAALGYFRHSALELGAEDREALIGSARRTLSRYIETGRRQPLPVERRTPALERRAPVFVTLRQTGELRGCIGRRGPCDALADAVPALTLAAALEDSRFRPVRRGEAGLEIDISVLSPFKRIPDRGCFRVNEHGAMLESGTRHGLLLPQVASERNWSAGQFFDALARKSGVSTSIYDDPATRLYAFRAQVIH